MPLLLGIDLGTSYFKAGLYTEEGLLKGLGRKPTPITSPAPGRREMDPAAFWSVLHDVVEMALTAADAAPANVAALSYSSQANTFLLLDGEMQPLTPLLIWQDTRSLSHPTPLSEYWETPEFFERTGISRHSPNFMPGKLEWMRHNIPDTWRKTRHAFTLSDYLASTLTGASSGDSGTASLTGLWDIPGDRWHTEALSLAELDPSWLPRLSCPATPIGKLSAGGASRIGLRPGLPIAAGSLDHHAAAIGSGLGRLAPVSISTGTVLAALRLTDEWQPIPGAFHGPDWRPGRFFALVADNQGAGILENFRRRYSPNDEFETLLEAADQVPPETALPEIPPEAWEDPDARHFSGLSPADPAERGVLVRAMMETIARRQGALLEKLCGAQLADTVIATGGGARSPLWLQIQARLLGARVLAPESAERACLGAAIFASVAAGLHPNIDEASERMVQAGRVYEQDG
jgi:xylulokinase